MESVINAIQKTPIPIILIVAGLFFLLLGFVSKLGGIIEVSPEQKRLTIPIGLLVLTIGLLLNFTPARSLNTSIQDSRPRPPGSSSVPTASPTPHPTLPNNTPIPPIPAGQERNAEIRLQQNREQLKAENERGPSSPAEDAIAKGPQQNFSMFGSWSDANATCSIEVYQDDGKSIRGTCDKGGYSHRFTGSYEGKERKRITLVNVRRDPKGCVTTVHGYIEILGENTVRYWQEGWDGCEVRTDPAERIWHRRKM